MATDGAGNLQIIGEPSVGASQMEQFFTTCLSLSEMAQKRRRDREQVSENMPKETQDQAA